MRSILPGRGGCFFLVISNKKSREKTPGLIRV